MNDGRIGVCDANRRDPRMRVPWGWTDAFEYVWDESIHATRPWIRMRFVHRGSSGWMERDVSSSTRWHVPHLPPFLVVTTRSHACPSVPTTLVLPPPRPPHFFLFFSFRSFGFGSHHVVPPSSIRTHSRHRISARLFSWMDVLGRCSIGE